MPDIGQKKPHAPSGLSPAKSVSKMFSIAGWLPRTAILSCWAMMTLFILFAMTPAAGNGS